jgi:uncharacterized membrane protein YdjX (TVP38/TMEM64 family)
MNAPDHRVFDEQPAADLEQEAMQNRAWVKPLFLLMVLAAGVLVVSLSPLKHYLRCIEDIRAWIGQFGYAGPVIYMLCVFALISMGFPRLLFCPIGGAVFGLFWGLVWTQIPTLVGYYVIFLFVRWGGRDFVLRRWPRLGGMHKVFHQGAIPTILVMRQLPISGLIINLLLSLSPILHTDFLIGTAIGLLPEAIAATAIGSSAVAISRGQGAAFIAISVVVLVLVWVGFSVLVHRSKTFADLRARYREGGS